MVAIVSLVVAAAVTDAFSLVLILAVAADVFVVVAVVVAAVLLFLLATAGAVAAVLADAGNKVNEPQLQRGKNKNEKMNRVKEQQFTND